MPVRDQNWKHRSFTRDPQAHGEPALRIFPNETDDRGTHPSLIRHTVGALQLRNHFDLRRPERVDD
jgi:hypothetical protein